MRVLGVLVFLVGLFLSFGSSFLPDIGVSRQVARFSVYRDGLFWPAEIALGPTQAPLAMKVEMQEGGVFDPKKSEAALTIIADFENKAVFTQAIEFTPKDKIAVEDGLRPAYSKIVGTLTDLPNGTYIFNVNQGDAGQIDIKSVDLILLTNSFTKLPDLSTFGTVMIWVGAALFVLGLRRRNRVDPNPPPPPAKWGRGA